MWYIIRQFWKFNGRYILVNLSQRLFFEVFNTKQKGKKTKNRKTTCNIGSVSIKRLKFELII